MNKLFLIVFVSILWCTGNAQLKSVQKGTGQNQVSSIQPPTRNLLKVNQQDNRTSNYIKAQVINGYNTICVPQNINSICQEEDILVTLSQDKDPNQILASLMNNDSKILVNEYFTYDNQGNLVVEVEKFVNSELSK